MKKERKKKRERERKKTLQREKAAVTLIHITPVLLFVFKGGYHDLGVPLTHVFIPHA